MNLKSTGIVTLHAYLPPQHAVKAKSAPVCFDESGCKINTFLLCQKDRTNLLAFINNINKNDASLH